MKRCIEGMAFIKEDKEMVKFSPEEIDKALDWLSSITKYEDVKGTTRLLYDEKWQEAQKSLEKIMEEIGMEVEYDDVGNLFGTVIGSEEPESVIATGSHVDTVVKGGRLDGQLGIMAGYLSIKKLIEEEGQPKKSLRLISMAEEEGSRFPYAFWGSKNIFGEVKREEVEGKVDGEGVKFEDAMRDAGFDFPSSDLKFNKMDAFIELHIEQGNFLEQKNKKVGVVNSIVGQKRWDIVLKGQSNHAGTTLMEYRKDTVEGMAKIVSQSLDRAKEAGNPLVLTFGRVDPSPNTVNVVPGKTSFSMDCRHTDQDFLNQFTAEVEDIMHSVAEELGLEIEISKWMDEPPVPMNEKIVDEIENVCKDLGLDYEVMHSGAGHDGQIFAPHVPTAMLFCPSIDGISHNPEEHTEAEDIVQSAEALAETFRRLAY